MAEEMLYGEFGFALGMPRNPKQPKPADAGPAEPGQAPDPDLR